MAVYACKGVNEAMQLDEQIMLWNHASVKVMDIRRVRMKAREKLPGYRLPANAFLYAVAGTARARLDNVQQQLGQFHVLHGGCGACLELEAEGEFEYMLVLYKAVLMLPRSRLLARLLEQEPKGKGTVLGRHYSFRPAYPQELLSMLHSMLRDWESGDPLRLFHARTLFYQFVHELLWQRQRQDIESVQPDLVAQATRYMQEHYVQPITLDSMSVLFDCSISYLTKRFRSQLQISPMRYLIAVRLDAAAGLLLQSEASLQEIAERVGYPDAHTFSRSFKKRMGCSPVQFKQRAASRSAVFSRAASVLTPGPTDSSAVSAPLKSQRQAIAVVPELPAVGTCSALPAEYGPCYSVKRYEDHSQLSGGVALNALTKTKRSASWTAAMLLLGLTLLLGACSGTPAQHRNQGSNGATASSNSQSVPVSTEQSSVAAVTRTYTDSAGEVVIPVQPERIVDLTGSAIGNLLLLGVKPVAAINDSMQSPFHEGLLDGIENIGDGTNLEKLLELNPDLIIAYNFMTDQQYEQLKQIAPVVRLTYGALKPAELLVEFGKLTGKEVEAQAWVERWNAQIAEVKPQVVAAVGDKTVSILQPHAKGIYAWGDKGGRGGEIIYGEFGLNAPELIREALIDGPGFGKDLSLEQVGEYAGDYIFTSSFGWGEDESDTVYSSSLWSSLDAVKNQRVYYIHPQGYFYNDPISLEAQLEFIVSSLLGHTP